MKLTHLKDLKPFLKLAWLARQAGMDRSELHYIVEQGKDMSRDQVKVRNLLASLKEGRGKIDKAIQRIEDEILATRGLN